MTADRADLTRAPAHRSFLRVGRPGRRAIAWVLLAPVLATAGYAALHPAAATDRVALVVVAALGAATLARYVPTVGLRPVLGCTPCAVAAGLSVPVAAALLASGAAGLGVAVAAMGLVQRLRQPDTCPT
ncbi:hypothetical protein Q6348_11770 [Isoptericola sp. b441]|uniref:Vitamin K epoxide reductase domain-containing protein n=1 Tax=Actinotalea lenta TaxID=3064654 RepID=A0ABT9DCH2_9CELL|nr:MULTISPECIES: hypothetical protein [unclassified Isoptericola]MDO8107873.1 hypothetical protein [Isoptericola sp. b441]MDO8120457.1 hypothetical protein [Isoptericola sp. b490]